MANHKRKKHQNTTDHNYVKKILDAQNAFQLGTVTQAIVAHDNWCSLYSGKGTVCDCDPTITYRTLTKDDEEGEHD